MPSAAPAPLSDEEFDELADLLDRYSPVDLDAVLGILHAAVVAPGLIPPSAWLGLVLPDSRQLPMGATEQLLGLVLRVYNELLEDLPKGIGLVPGSDEIAACESFAAGYAAAAALDPLWIGDADRWTFAAPVAYLGGRLDLVPEAMLEQLESTSDTKETVRRDLGSIVVAARNSFDRVRRGQPTETRINAAPRPGRNDPCHCGSGKKYKRCCLAQVSAIDRDRTAALDELTRMSEGFGATEYQGAAGARLRLSAAGSSWAVGSPRMNARGTLLSAMTEPELVNSPLEREISINGTTVKICIYRSEVETSWILEVEDHLGGSTVWDDRFATDKEALDAAMAAVEEDGIESFAQATGS